MDSPEQKNTISQLDAKHGPINATPANVLVARSPAMARAIEQLGLAAQCSVPLTMVSEPGCDAVALARLVHQWSGMDAQAFALLDASSLPADRMEERLLDLLGAEWKSEPSTAAEMRRGQSTPFSQDTASRTHDDPGRRTLCVLEPARLERAAQRMLRSACANRVLKPRVIAIDSQMPKNRALAGEFDTLLAEVLSTFVVALPPLRERREDIAELVAQWLKDTVAENSPTVDPSALAVLAAYDWPGNLDELRAVLATANRRSSGGPSMQLSLKDLPRRFSKPEEIAQGRELDKPPPLDEILEQVEARMIRLALERFKGNKSQAAAFLGVSRARIIRAGGKEVS